MLINSSIFQKMDAMETHMMRMNSALSFEQRVIGNTNPVFEGILRRAEQRKAVALEADQFYALYKHSPSRHFLDGKLKNLSGKAKFLLFERALSIFAHVEDDEDPTTTSKLLFEVAGKLWNCKKKVPKRISADLCLITCYYGSPVDFDTWVRNGRKLSGAARLVRRIFSESGPSGGKQIMTAGA